MNDVMMIRLNDYLTRPLPQQVDDLNYSQKHEALKTFGYDRTISGYQFNPNQFSREFCKYVTLRLLGNHELVLFNYAEGIYELDSEVILQKLIKYFMNLYEDLWSPRDADIALKAIRHDTTMVVNQFNNGDYLVLKDKVMSLSDFTLHPHSPDYFATVRLPFSYNSYYPTPIFDKYLDDIACSDDELKRLLQEITGYCLCNSTAAEKGFFLVGNGCNGKSVYARLLQLLVGEGNYSTTTLSSLNGNFGLASLVNSNVNISSENNCEKINPEIFKAIVSGDVVEVNRKYKDALSVKLHTKLVMIFNTLPESNDLTYGFFRKIIIFPFNNTIDRNKTDVELIDKLANELPGIFNWAIEGLKRLKNNKYRFSPCKASDLALENYKSQLNPVASFFEDHYFLNPNSSVKKSEIYHIYEFFCQKNCFDAIPRQRFWKLLNSYFMEKNLVLRVKRIKGYDYIDGIEQLYSSAMLIEINTTN